MGRSLTIAASVFVVLSACVDPHVGLLGSIDETHSLAFDRNVIVKQGTTLRIEYVKGFDRAALEKPCKLVVETAGLVEPIRELSPKRFEQLVEVERVMADGGSFPPVVEGNLVFNDDALVVGARVSGHFGILFDNGRNLLGDFFAKIEEAEGEE